jgi:Lipocalin-like domain
MNMNTKMISMAVLIALTAMGLLTGCGSSVEGGDTITTDKLARFWAVTKLSGYGKSVTCPGLLRYPLDETTQVSSVCEDPKIKPNLLYIEPEVQGIRYVVIDQNNPASHEGSWTLNGNTLTIVQDNKVTLTIKVTRLTDTELVLEWPNGITITYAAFAVNQNR